MQRKLEIVRSLIHTPKILFLDEPTQGLDAEARRNLWEYIDVMRKATGMTVFLTTHYIDEAEGTDKVCLINHGKIAVCASPEEMKASLLRQELIVDATDRGALTGELAGLGLSPAPEEEGGHLVVPYQGSAQEIIARLNTKLTTLKIHEPSLEDAYVEFLDKTEKTERKAA